MVIQNPTGGAVLGDEISRLVYLVDDDQAPAAADYHFAKTGGAMILGHHPGELATGPEPIVLNAGGILGTIAAVSVKVVGLFRHTVSATKAATGVSCTITFKVVVSAHPLVLIPVIRVTVKIPAEP